MSIVSIIIPAHNEAAVIRKTLQTVTAGAPPGELDVVVVCNGCHDATARIAREFGGSVRVVETDRGSKVHALNLGDSVAQSFPRIYLDADVLLPETTVQAIVDRFSDKSILAIAPKPRFDLAGSSWCVRAFYDIHQRLPSSSEGIGGSGVYALTESGRGRFGKFPDITADDGFVRLQFSEQERRTLTDGYSVVTVPKTLGALISIKSRSHFGTYELQARYPHLWCNRGPGNSGALRRLMLNPLLWPKLMVYGYVKILARLRAKRRMRLGESHVWERDNTSRAPVANLKTA